MDLDLSPTQLRIRREVARWLRKERPQSVPLELNARFAALREWQQKLYAAGWLGFGWPVEFGGRGGSPFDQVIVYQELIRTDSPPPIGLIGLDVVGPTIVASGTHTQRATFVRHILSGKHIWCQGFSEPNAGSDLASLETKAVKEGDDFVITGRKIWTSYAQFADWCAVLARTGPEHDRYRNITFFLVDMRTPGIAVRPVEQATGDEEFSEVHFDAVRVGSDSVLGEVNNGWKIAMHTLSMERGPYVLRRQIEVQNALDRLVFSLSSDRANVRLRQRLGRCMVLADALEAHSYAIASRMLRDDVGFESSTDKLFLSAVEQEVFALPFDALGRYRTITSGIANGDVRARSINNYLFSRAASIFSGTAQIQRNIVARRILGLPGG